MVHFHNLRNVLGFSVQLAQKIAGLCDYFIIPLVSFLEFSWNGNFNVWNGRSSIWAQWNERRIACAVCSILALCATVGDNYRKLL